MAPTPQQWQGTERRQSQGSYIGEERRKPNPMPEEAAGNPGQATQDPKDGQQLGFQRHSRDDTQ
jgi:hypothetical protein